MCQRAGLLIGWDDNSARALVARAECDSWNCPECADRMANHWRMRAIMGTQALNKAGYKVDFVTITSHEKLKSFEATEYVWRAAWSTLYAALKRQQPSLEYMIVPEKHKDGRMHVHAVWNAGVSQKWLKDNARKRGLGYAAKVKPVIDGSVYERYITKYIGKDLGENVPAHFRRVRVSRGWTDLAAPETETKGLRWEYIGSNGALDVVYKECAAKHISLVDLETGEYFDDVDLGTIVAYNYA